MSDQVEKTSAAAADNGPDQRESARQAKQPEFKATHVAKQWKYTSPLIACRFDPLGRYVFAAAQDNTIQRWELATDKQTSLSGHDSWLRGIGFSPDGEAMYSAGYDGQLIWWSTAADSPNPELIVQAHDGWIRWLSVSPDGQYVATGGNDHLVKLWNADDGKLVKSLEGHSGHVYSTLFDTKENLLLSGDLLGKVIQWDVASGKQIASFDAKDLHTYNGGQGAHYGGVRSMSISPDGKYLACSGLHKATNPFGAVQEPLVVVFEYDSKKKVQSHTAEGIPKGIVWRSFHHPSGTLIGCSGGGSGGFILFWNHGQEKEIHKFKLPNTALDIDMHADTIQLATVHYDKHLRISRMQKKTEA